MKRVLMLPMVVVLLISFSSFGESTKSVAKSATVTNSSKGKATVHKTREVKDQSGNWSKIKSLFL